MVFILSPSANVLSCSVQSDEADMGMTYDELTVFGRYVPQADPALP